MSYSYEEMTDEQLDVQDDLEMLREVLAYELQTINQYQDYLLYMENEDASATVERIVDQNKEHVAELLKLIQALDPVQGEKLKKIL